VEFKLGQIFKDKYPPEAAVWCNNNGAFIEKTSEGYVIKEVPGPSSEELFVSLRSIRDARLAETDYVFMPDYDVSDELKAKVVEYRKNLRDLPSQPGAPWDGGGENTPWPVNPITKK